MIFESVGVVYIDGVHWDWLYFFFKIEAPKFVNVLSSKTTEYSFLCQYVHVLFIFYINKHVIESVLSTLTTTYDSTVGN